MGAAASEGLFVVEIVVVPDTAAEVVGAFGAFKSSRELLCFLCDADGNVYKILECVKLCDEEMVLR